MLSFTIGELDTIYPTRILAKTAGADKQWQPHMAFGGLLRQAHWPIRLEPRETGKEFV